MQSAVTLGGGSLAGALYLGVLSGYELLWLQPLAMVCGVVMLCALSFVTLTTHRPPFESVKESISPALAWAWLLGTVIADIAFCVGQTSLGIATAQQNLGLSSFNPWILSILLSGTSFGAVLLYLKGSAGGRALENVLKILVGIVVISFFGASIVLLSAGEIGVSSILKGLIPDFGALFRPVSSIQSMIDATGDASGWWRDFVVSHQRDTIITAFGAAVGINMMFLLPYTLLRKKWGKGERELAIYDLIFGLLVPFSIATLFIVVSAAAQFHRSTDGILLEDGTPVPQYASGFYNILGSRQTALDPDGGWTPEKLASEIKSIPEADRMLAAALTRRDAGQLSTGFAPLMGDRAATLVFGVGILAMAFSTMIVLMIMNGFAISQAAGAPGNNKAYLIGASLPAIASVFTPFLWSGDAKLALLVPAAVTATTLLPIAYLCTLLLFNSKAVMGPDVAVKRRWLINLFLGISLFAASFGSVWALSAKGTPGKVGIGVLVLLGIVGVFKIGRRK